MRATPHYPPPQPNTSARTDYNTYPSASRNDGYAAEAYPTEQQQQQQVSHRGRTPQSSSQMVRRASQQQQPTQQQQQQQRLSTAHAPPMNDDYSSVVYTVQDTHTDTHAHETEYGGVLTIRTTTVTRTITERLVRSDEDEDSSEEDEMGGEAA